MHGFIPSYLVQNILLNADKNRLKLSTKNAFSSIFSGIGSLFSASSDVESLAGKNRTVYDAENKTSLPGVVAREEGSEENKDSVVNDAYDFSGATYNFLKEVLGRDSVDGKGYPLKSTVHYGKNYPNAFYNGRQIVFGDGDGEIFLQFCLLDILGHELGHSVVSNTANLIYRNQSGACNEHYADVFGMCIKQRELGQESKDSSWIVGEGIFHPSIQGSGIRSMKMPGTAYSDSRIGKDRQPNHMKDIYAGDEDGGGVHWNCGILNRIFYEYCINVGGTSYSHPIKIWYETLVTKLTPSSDFQHFVNSIQEVIIQNTGTGIEYKAFKEAAKCVGLIPRHPVFKQMGL